MSTIVMCFLLSASQELVLAEEGRTEYSIVLSTKATATEAHAAQELATYLSKMSGAVFPVTHTAGKPLPPGKAILIGPDACAAAPQAAIRLSEENLGQEGYVIAAEGEEKDWLYVEIEGDGFLYNMVRNIVGTLVDIGNGRWKPEKITEILEARDRTAAGLLAPASGLCLMWIKY